MKTKLSAPLVYIGPQRRCSLERLAVEISFTSGRIISPAKLVQFLIDEYSEQARVAMLKLFNGHEQESSQVKD